MMTEVGQNQILYPAFAMFFLVAFVLTRMARMRFGGVRKGAVDPRFYVTYDKGEEPKELRVITRHFINLFEMPMLFYVGVILIYITHQVNYWLIFCAWAYVGLRYLHTYVHLGTNDVLTRFRVYFASGFVLLLMWSSLLVQLLRMG